MFQEAESDPKIAVAEYKKLEAHLRVRLLNEQYRHLNLQDRALLVIVAGIDGAGKGETINLLNEWMDPRHIHTLAFGAPNKQEREFPVAHRFWRHLPPKGETGIVFGSGYSPLFAEAAKNRIDTDQFERQILFVRKFESSLIANGVQVLKLWFHLSREAQHERTEHLLSNPSTAWQVTKLDLKAQKNFDAIRWAGQLVIEATDSPHSPWMIIPSADAQLRTVRTAQAILGAFTQRSLKAPAFHDPAEAKPLHRVPNPLDKLDHKVTITKSDYDTQVLAWQNRLAQAVRSKAFRKRALMVAFEGADAAGKGGAIRRVTRAIDARQFDIMAVSAPKPWELAHPYLWRFWRNVPEHGRVAIFDRSWYGRVLVERVEKLIPRESWRRAYDEINDFEQQLSGSGIILLKFWLSVTPDEQLRRFRERQESPFKQFKITPEDWRNRRNAKQYAEAARDMFAQTDTPHAPWHVLSANDKKHARVEVLKHIVLAVERALA